MMTPLAQPMSHGSVLLAIKNV